VEKTVTLTGEERDLLVDLLDLVTGPFAEGEPEDEKAVAWSLQEKLGL